MAWTTPEDLAGQVERLWASGRLLAAAPSLQMPGADAEDGLPFPLQLRLRRPSARELGEQFEAVRAWTGALVAGSKGERGVGYAIDWEEVNTRRLGRNRLPSGVHVDTRHDALTLIGKAEDASRFDDLAGTTLERFPPLRAWLRRRPLVALENAGDWPRILDCLAWFRDHPRSGVYIRQIDVAGVDTKFIEARKALLAELLDVLLPPDAIEASPGGAKGFEIRYGLRAKSPLVRFRILDAGSALAGLTDITVPAEQFAQLALDIRRVFVVENDITGLAFPPVAESIAVFGLGHAVGLLAPATWLGSCEIYCWSDIDTHGFAMLDRLRAQFAHSRSMLMDRDTLLTHRAMWTSEDTPLTGNLERLTTAEAEVYADLRFDRLGRAVRLEQERIAFSRLREALDARFGS